MTLVADGAPTGADVLLESLPAAVCVLDADERHVVVNRAYACWLGRAPAAILGRCLAELLAPARYAEVRPHLAVARSGASVRLDLRAADAAGDAQRLELRLMPLDDRGEGPRVLWLALPVAAPASAGTAQAPDAPAARDDVAREMIAALEEALCHEAAARRGAEQRRDGLLAALPDLMFEMDAAGHIVDHHAPDPARLIAPPGHFLGKPFDEVLPANVAGLLRGALDALDRTGAMQRFEYRVGKGVDLRHYEARLVALALGNRLAIVRDITDLRQAGFEIAALNRDLAFRAAELEASNRELESFAYSVSHDLRAPLRAIDGFSRLLALHAEDRLDAEGRGYLERIRRGVRRMSRLIDDLLQLSRASRSELVRARIDVTGLVLVLAEELANGDAGRDVTFAIEPGLSLQGDPSLLRIAFANLVGNAWKFTSRRAGARIEVGCAPTQHGEALYVRDNGAGFDMAYADKLFTAFHRLHGPHEFEGSGIGLATVQRIVSRHGGRVWAEGVVDRGATVWLVIP